MENDNKNAPDNTSDNNSETVAKLKADHDSLYGKYSAKSADLYKVGDLAYKANPLVLVDLPDEVKDRITKNTFGVDTFEEAIAILGEDFYKKGENKNKEDSVNTSVEEALEQFQKEKKVSEYRLKTKEEELAIDTYIAKNSKLFENIENPKELIKKEIKKISDGLSIEERLEDASSLVKIKYGKNINFANTTSGGSVNITDKTVKRHAGLASIFGNKI